MKITFAMWGTERTGGTNAIFQVVDRLALYGHEVTVVAMGPRYDGWFDFKSNINFVFPEAGKFSTLKYRKKRFTLSQLIQYLFRKFGRGLEISRTGILSSALPADSEFLIATYFETAFAVQMSQNLSANRIYYIQHFESVFFQEHFSKQRVKQTYFFPFSWIVSSTWANERLREETGRSGKVIIPGIDRNTFYPRVNDKRNSKFVVVALGKGAKVKGLAYLLDALSMAKMVIPDITLHLYGVEPELKRLSPVETIYHFAPNNERLAEIYSSANAVVTPSLYESSPSPPLEAMACGAPVITTQFGTEDYCKDHFNSLVVPPENAQSISEALIEIYRDQDLKNRLIENGLKTVNDTTWDNTAKAFEKVLLKIKNNSS